ncbi:3',5'-cyclic AMP phosphodiesterase CpdA [Actinocorallia herbida]|uniref:3',5'-cyclic AMP phosphodiesterase CpdA n=1 Tax=Actinocorallia herbida TaxID=58109 RepID=A0A3N1CXX9_9ACTN|nr:metallophosphoesterase [Actinocorallia herbida]ROO86149.1 3',5'-cyclic AMP phosphodiesterase CpdA [Actinocorallia herbida]
MVVRRGLRVPGAVVLVLGLAGAPGAAARAEGGVWLSVEDGDVLDGGVELLAADRAGGGQAVSLRVDGEDVPVTTVVPQIAVSFQADGFDAGDGHRNSLWVNGVKAVEPKVSAHGYAKVTVPVPATAFRAGANTVRLSTGSTEATDDPDGGNDDFTVQDLKVTFPDGTTAKDPADRPFTRFPIGDVAGRPRHHDWHIDVPAVQVRGLQSHGWDTAGLAERPYEIVATSADGARVARARVAVDHSGPVSLDLSDGDTVSGDRELVAGGAGEVQISVDGRPLETTRRDSADPAFVFDAHGLETGRHRDSVWLNSELLAEPEPGTVTDYARVRIPVPLAKLKPGRNVLRIRTGTATATADGAGDNDDFIVRDARLEFGAGRTLRDPAFDPATGLAIGDDGPVKTYHRDWTFTVPDDLRTEHAARWDSTAVADGPHTVAASRPGGAREAAARVVVDNTGPAVTVRSPEAGERYRTPFTVDAAVTDPHRVVSVARTLDGRTVHDGAAFTADDLEDGAHTLAVAATDALGNTTERTVRFSTLGNFPDTPSDPFPADRTTEVSPTRATLGVTVADPAGDPVDVALKWAYLGDFTDRAAAATEGVSTSPTPARVAGEAIETAALAADDGRTATVESDRAYPFQQFDLAVPRDLAAPRHTVTWHGTVPAGQRAVLSVWNHATRSWQPLADGQGGADLALSGEAEVADTVRRGRARFMVQNVPASVISDRDAVFAWITDTQHYSEREPDTFQKMVDWAIENRHGGNIGYGVHTGDIVNDADAAEHWARASQIMRTWDEADLPYGIVPGNHDLSDGRYDAYRALFGADRYAGRPWYGGTADDNVQHYDLVSTPRADYLIVYLDWSLDDAEIAWADRIIKAHPGHNVVIATHIYLNTVGAYSGPGRRIFNRLVRPNENVALVLSGHFTGAARNVRRLGDRTVVEVMADYQEVPTSGGGWMRTLAFDTEHQKLTNQTFSVLTGGDHHWQEDLENFTEDITLRPPKRAVTTDHLALTAKTTRTLAALADVPSGTRFTAPTGLLRPATRHTWYAEATDADGHRTTSPVWSFTTGALRPAWAPSAKGQGRQGIGGARPGGGDR